jgi:signal peptidase I
VDQDSEETSPRFAAPAASGAGPARVDDSSPPDDDPSTPDAESPPPEAGTPPEPRRRQARGCLVELLQTVALTLILFLGIQTFVVQPFQVELRSMESTFIGGDYVLVDRLTDLWSPYRRGEVVVFEPPASWAVGQSHPFIKRVIGVGGDTIEIDDDGRVLVNGVVIDEQYLHRDQDGALEPTDPTGGQTRWTVPSGDLFVMGDHRGMSADSRIFGPIPSSSVVGRAVLRYWPASKFGTVVTPTYDNLPAP